MYNIVESTVAQNFSNTEFLKIDLGINEWYVRRVWPSSFMYNLHPQLLDLYVSLYSIIYYPVIIKLFISSLVTTPSMKQLLPHAAYYHVL